MSNFVTTNIRILEKDYLRLKQEAAQRRKSLAAIMREKLTVKEKARSKTEAKKFMQEIRKHAAENAKYTKEFNSVKALREIRYQDE